MGSIIYLFYGYTLGLGARLRVGRLFGSIGGEEVSGGVIVGVLSSVIIASFIAGSIF